MATEPEGFDISAEDAARLDALFESVSGDAARHLRSALAAVADPSLVLLRLTRFLEGCGCRNAHESRMAGSESYAELLCSVFDQSEFLSGVVTRNPEYLDGFDTAESVDAPRAPGHLLDTLRAAVADAGSYSDACEAMRRVHRREILRIALLDIFVHASIPVVTRALSDLADALLQVAYEKSFDELRARFGTPVDDPEDGARCEAKFMILGMGKLGGRELNFSSDIDLIFVYSSEGQTEGESTRSISNSEFFSKLGESIIKAFTDQTAEGQLFRVDMRLRPHGRKGPLAMGLRSTVLYYELQGQAWERQALIKARVVAGDAELGRAFIERTRPFVFPKYFDDATLEEIRAGKARLEAEVARAGRTEDEVKLGSGGIRDIEFTVQMLQLLNGGPVEELRTTNTLEAIEVLGRHGLLSGFEALTLSRNYVFLRQVEHRLQIEGSQQRHALPKQPDKLNAFGKRLGYLSGTAFFSEYQSRSEETRKILERFFAQKGAGNLWINDVLDPDSDAADGLAHLEAMGFADIARARRDLISMHEGTRERPHSAHVRQQFREVMPGVLRAVSASSNPNATLSRLERMLASLRAPSAIYDILKHNPDLATALTTLISNSPFLTDYIIQDPGLFETFGYAGELAEPTSTAALEAELGLLRSAANAEAALYRLRRAQTLRIAMRELLLNVDIVEIGRELSCLADLCVREALADARAKTAERFGAAEAGFAVLSLGKLGGEEMSFGSDLDLVFVHEGEGAVASGMSAAEYFANTASNLIKILEETTPYGKLYDTDNRLRPDGKKGTLTVSDARFRAYYRDEAQPWERLALVKARAIAGDEPFAQRIEAAARELAFDAPLAPGELAEVEDIRARLAGQCSEFELKRREGGLAEIEFTVRLLQLSGARKIPELKRSDVLGALGILTKERLLSEEDATTLREAYVLFRTLENRVRMGSGRSDSSLPKEDEQRIDLAKRLGLATDPLTLVQEHAARVHAIYTRVRESLRG